MSRSRFHVRLDRLEGGAKARRVRCLWDDGNSDDLDARVAELTAQGFDVVYVGWAGRMGRRDSVCCDQVVTI